MIDNMHFSKPIQTPLDEISGLCRLLKVLANPNRLRILLYLLDSEVSVGEIESSLDIRQPSLSHELRKLREAELVSTKRQSKVVFYRLKSNAVKTMLISVCSTLDESMQLNGDYQPLQVVGETHKSKALECGVFANIQQQLNG